MRTRSSSHRVLTLLFSAAFLWGVQAQGVPPGGQGGGGRRGGGPPVPYDDYTGFTKLWDGATFTNWDGETDVWTIEEGAIHADTTKTPGQHHIHYIGPGAVMRDFDLKVEVKISATGANGGIQYRSRLLHASRGGSIQDPLGKKLPPGITTMAQALAAGVAPPPAPRGTPPPAGGGGRAGPAGPNGPTNEPNPWQVSGYQFDMDSNNQYTGMLYEGQGRGIVMSPGTIVELLPDRITARLGTITETPAALLKPHLGLAGEWQQIEIIARGNTLIHMINGKVISVIVDDNPLYRAFQGILSLQLEGNGQIWYRNVYVKPLDKPMEFPK
jgi:3-keto-disaccharide hydrolase